MHDVTFSVQGQDQTLKVRQRSKLTSRRTKHSNFLFFICIAIAMMIYPGKSSWRSYHATIDPAAQHYMVSHRGHPWSLSASHSSSTRRKVTEPKSCLQHQPTCCCTCCGSIFGLYCGKRHTSKHHLTSPPISLSSARSGMASQLLLLFRLT